jgi:hypothetical protein
VWNTGRDIMPVVVFIFCDLMNCQFDYTQMISNCSSAHFVVHLSQHLNTLAVTSFSFSVLLYPSSAYNITLARYNTSVLVLETNKQVIYTHQHVRTIELYLIDKLQSSYMFLGKSPSSGRRQYNGIFHMSMSVAHAQC